MWSGWGIRTLSSRDGRLQPDRLPPGHDLAARQRHLRRGPCALRALRGGAPGRGALLEATPYFRDARLPELFCGFDRADSPLPVPYPVACSPQAWAAGSLFHLLGAMLGLAARRARASELELRAPVAARLAARAAAARTCASATRWSTCWFGGTDGSTGVEVLRRSGDLDVVVRRLSRAADDASPSSCATRPQTPRRERLRDAAPGCRAAAGPRAGRRPDDAPGRIPKPSSATARRPRFEELVERRAAGEPVAYIRGIKEFHGLALTRRSARADPAAGDRAARRPGAGAGPRRADRRRHGQRTRRRCGSGTSARAAAPSRSRSRSTLRRRGFGTTCAVGDRRLAPTPSRWPSRTPCPRRRRPIEFLVADLLDRATPAPATGRPAARQPALHPERRRADPAGRGQLRARAALDGGPDGLDVIRRLLAELPERSSPGGVALLEIGADQADAVRRLPRRGAAGMVRRRSTTTWPASRGWSSSARPDERRIIAPRPSRECASTRAARRALRWASIVAIPTETVYGLAVLPRRGAARAADRGQAALDREGHPAAGRLAGAGRRSLALLPTPPSGSPSAFWPGALTLVAATAARTSTCRSCSAAAGRRSASGCPTTTCRARSRACSARSPPARPTSPASPTRRRPSWSRRALGDAVALVLDDGPVRGGVPSTVVDCSTAGRRAARPARGRASSARTIAAALGQD